MRVTGLLAIASLFLVGGCAEYQYVYEPAVGSRTMAGGYPAAYYGIPANGPRGDVRVTTFGLTQAQQKNGTQVPTVQLRLVVANNSDPTPWTIDTRQVLLDINGVGQSRPAFVNTDAGSPPVVQIEKGQRRTIDLYYPLPGNLGNEDKLPAFSVAWQINTGTGTVSQRTPFERERVDTTYASNQDDYYYGYPGYPYYSADVGIGFGPYWWYDPLYPSYGFYGHPVIIGRPWRMWGGPYYRHFGGPYYGWGRPGWGGYRGGGYYRGGGFYRGGGYRGGGFRGGGFRGGGGFHGGGGHGGRR